MSTAIHTQLSDGSIQVSWDKVCPHCHRHFTTTSRRQKYCSPSCCKKHSKQLQESRARYSKVKEFERLRSRSHALAVSTIRLLCDLGVRTWSCDCCGSTDSLEVHHVHHYNWMDNTPSNLRLLCKRCHAKAHSDQEALLNQQGILLSEWYEPSMRPIYQALNKNSLDL